MLSIMCPECWKEEIYDEAPGVDRCECPNCGEVFSAQKHAQIVDGDE